MHASAGVGLFVNLAIEARGAERHGAWVTPQSGCHELLKVAWVTPQSGCRERRKVWVAGLMSEAVGCTTTATRAHYDRCPLMCASHDVRSDGFRSIRPRQPL